MWCKTRAAHRTLVLPSRAWAHAWGKYRVYLFSMAGKTSCGAVNAGIRNKRDVARATSNELRPFFDSAFFFALPPDMHLSPLVPLEKETK